MICSYETFICVKIWKVLIVMYRENFMMCVSVFYAFLIRSSSIPFTRIQESIIAFNIFKEYASNITVYVIEAYVECTSMHLA